jgi:hypothetical protein
MAMTGAERQARWRAKRAAAPIPTVASAREEDAWKVELVALVRELVSLFRDALGDGRYVTKVTKSDERHVTGSRASEISDLPLNSEKSEREDLRTRAGEVTKSDDRHVTKSDGPSRDETPPDLGSQTRIREGRPMASDDGAFGMTASAWADGVRQVTGKPCTPPRGSQLAPLNDALKLHKPPDAEPVQWVTESAKAYASANAGRRHHVFAWVDWLNSGSPVQGQTPVPGLGFDPAKADERSRAREREHKEYLERAVAPPSGLADLVKTMAKRSQPKAASG